MVAGLFYLGSGIGRAIGILVQAANVPQTWVEMVREIVELDDADSVRVFGESLPAGLKLIVA
jgi:hypothetical protein